jgi:hypothetical protein
MKSALQVHVRLPALLVQVASALQPPLLVAHGFVPENTEQVGLEAAGQRS